MKITVATDRGLRHHQEDVLLWEEYSDLGVLLGVFDGHGGSGTAKQAAALFKEIFPQKQKEIISTLSVLDATFASVAEKTRGNYDGSTASVVFIQDAFAYVATIGDSPVIIKAANGEIHESEDHNVRSNQKEAQAAINRGGIINSGYLFASYSGDGLQMSRALGDYHLNRVLNREPHTFAVPLGIGSFVLLATDGVFDPGHHGSFTPADAVNQIKNPEVVACNLVDSAVARQTGDNATAILVRMEAGDGFE